MVERRLLTLSLSKWWVRNLRSEMLMVIVSFVGVLRWLIYRVEEMWKVVFGLDVLPYKNGGF